MQDNKNITVIMTNEINVLNKRDDNKVHKCVVETHFMYEYLL